MTEVKEERNVEEDTQQFDPFEGERVGDPEVDPQPAPETPEVEPETVPVPDNGEEEEDGDDGEDAGTA